MKEMIGTSKMICLSTAEFVLSGEAMATNTNRHNFDCQTVISDAARKLMTNCYNAAE